jgi:hypothetical protein
LILSEEDIKQLLAIKTETKNLDYKESLNWESGPKDLKLEMVKDILAMANTQDGGKIVFGVRNGDLEFTGMPEDDFKSFDQTKVNDFLHKYTDPDHSCQVYKHSINGNYLVIIQVPEFVEVPIICKTDANSSVDRSKQILKQGQIYIRTDKATSEAIPSAQEMRELLGRALTKKGDELLHYIERLIKGKPLKPSEESREKYIEEIKEAEDFLLEHIGNELKDRGYWTVYAYPTEYDPNRISDQKNIRELLQKSKVSLTGWEFPYTDLQNSSNFTKGRQSYTIWDRFREGYRAYKSGLFLWEQVFWEDVQGYKSNDDKPVLEYIYSIWLITDFFLFFKRYYEEIAPESDLYVKIILNRTKDRKLFSSQRASFFNYRFSYFAHDDSVTIEEHIKVVDLRASFKEIANLMIRKIFAVFNWDDVSEAYIDQWQTKLIEGKV